MNKAGAFIKKCWITFCIFSGLVPLYVYVTENKLVNPYLFPSVDVIKQIFTSGRGMMVGDILASFRLLISPMTASLPIVLLLGTIMGANTRVREVLYPIIYAFSVTPPILSPPFVLLMAPSLFSASVFLIVYNITWVTLFATITGITTIDKRCLDRAATPELQGSKRLIEIILPAANPPTLTRFVSSLCSPFVMLVFVEICGAGQGMGYFVEEYAELGIFANTWASFVFMVIMLVIVIQTSGLLKKHLLKWTIDQENSAENQRQLDGRLEEIKLA